MQRNMCHTIFAFFIASNLTEMVLYLLHDRETGKREDFCIAERNVQLHPAI